VESLRGHLLIAGPALVDPNFWRTVVLVGEHNEEGALGVVLNRSSETSVEEALPEFAELAEDIFTDDPEGLWSGVLRRKGGPFRVLAAMPPDPSQN